MRLSRSRALLLYAAVLSAVSACRCKSEEPASVEKPRPKRAATPDPSPEPDFSKLLRCGDFLSPADVTELGLEAAKYNPDHKQPNAALGVDCRIGNVTIAIYHGSFFDSMREGAANGIAQGMLEKQDGPTIGREALWTALQQADTVTFLASDGRYAAAISGANTGTDVLEKVARKLDANMQKQ